VKEVFLPNNSGDPIKKLQFLKDKTKLHTHTISESMGDCNSISIELGDYEISDSTITFYSYWAHAGDAPASPYGIRKQVYILTPEGKLKQVKSGIYIEEAVNKIPHELEKAELKQYVKDVEKKYNAKFVYGKDKENLFKEVKEKLKEPIQKETKHWKSVYKDKLGGYKI
jgi:hypothetical protein